MVDKDRWDVGDYVKTWDGVVGKITYVLTSGTPLTSTHVHLFLDIPGGGQYSVTVDKDPRFTDGTVFLLNGASEIVAAALGVTT